MVSKFKYQGTFLQVLRKLASRPKERCHHFLREIPTLSIWPAISMYTSKVDTVGSGFAKFWFWIHCRELVEIQLTYGQDISYHLLTQFSWVPQSWFIQMHRGKLLPMSWQEKSTHSIKQKSRHMDLLHEYLSQKVRIRLGPMWAATLFGFIRRPLSCVLRLKNCWSFFVCSLLPVSFLVSRSHQKHIPALSSCFRLGNC